jgi:hypothetical protein
MLEINPRNNTIHPITFICAISNVWLIIGGLTNQVNDFIGRTKC